MNKKLFHIVYLTSCSETGKLYIGKHSTNDLGDGYQGSGLWVKRALASGSKLTTEAIGSYKTEVEAYEAEREFIAAFRFDCPDRIMNFQDGGEGWSKGKKQTLEHTQKSAKSRTGRKFSEETKRKISQSQLGKKRPNKWLGRKHTEEAKKKISASKKGRKMSESERQKLIKNLTGRKMGESFKRKVSLRVSKWVVCLDTGMVFFGVGAAAEFYGISKEMMYKVLSGKRKSPNVNAEYMN